MRPEAHLRRKNSSGPSASLDVVQHNILGLDNQIGDRGNDVSIIYEESAQESEKSTLNQMSRRNRKDENETAQEYQQTGRNQTSPSKTQTGYSKPSAERKKKAVKKGLKALQDADRLHRHSSNPS